MSFFLSAVAASWLAGGVVLCGLCLFAASVGMLLPRRLARLAAVLWVSSAVVALFVSVAVMVRAPAWHSFPLAYTPHLERPLPHLCFQRVAQTWFGAELIRLGSLATCGLFVAALSRLLVMSAATAAACRRASHLPTVANPFYSRVVEDGKGGLTRTVGFLRPVVIVSRSQLAALPVSAQAAVILHEVAHARWRDPLAGLILRAMSWWWPLIGGFVERKWREAAETAADVYAASRSSVRVVRPQTGTVTDFETGQAPGGNESAGSLTGAIATAASWALLIGTLLAAYGHSAWLSVICVFETVQAAWQ